MWLRAEAGEVTVGARGRLSACAVRIAVNVLKFAFNSGFSLIVGRGGVKMP